MYRSQRKERQRSRFLLSQPQKKKIGTSNHKILQVLTANSQAAILID